MMTVEELRAKLDEMPDHARVMLTEGEYAGYSDVHEVVEEENPLGSGPVVRISS